MPARNAARKGFTLVEILIVVVILGILAAIVIPQFTSASETAKASSLVSQLQTLRSQLELYQVQHNGSYPTLAAMNVDTSSDGPDWQPLTELTDINGTVYTTAPTDGTITYGPYLQKSIKNPFEDSAVLVASVAEGSGWVYDEDTGEVTAIIDADKAAEVGLDAADGDITTY